MHHNRKSARADGAKADVHRSDVIPIAVRVEGDRARRGESVVDMDRIDRSNG